LKCKLTYKGQYEYEYEYVDTTRVRRALQCLKAINVHYKDVEFNDAWVNDFIRAVESCIAREDSVTAEAGVRDEGDDELLHDRQQHCMFQDSCLMPVDFGQEVLDQYFNDV